MQDIEIKISKETRMVDLSKTIIGNEAENLQGNLVFSFVDGFVNGQGRLEYDMNGERSWLTLEKADETYRTPIKSILTKNGHINMQLVITEGTNEEEIAVFKSNVFYLFCNSSINAIEEAPEGYDSWLEIANSKLNQVDNLDLDLQDNILTITKKDGTTKSENVKGDVGPSGPQGNPGPSGPPGPKGETALTISIGKIETANPDVPANVVNVGTDKDLVLDFVLPKGETGETGKQGKDYVITEKDYDEIGEQVKTDIQPLLNDINETSDNALEIAQNAENIAKGKSASVVFETAEELEVWLKDAKNKGIHNVGDNLYIKEMWINEEEGIRQPDYWITEVLQTPNELGYYYNISDLGVEHPDLTNLLSKDEIKEKYLLITYEDETTETIKLVVYK